MAKHSSKGAFGKFLRTFYNNRFGWLAAGIACIIMAFVFMCYKIYPFGDVTILRMDLYHQYGPLYSELYDKITSGGSLLYSWNSGLGGNFLGNLLNYCSSPFAIVMLIAGHYDMPGAIAWMILLKAAFASWCFSYFIRKSFGRNDCSTSAFALAYTFSGFFIAYYWDLMWLDAFAVFPLVILGIEYIVNGKKPTLFFFSLAYTMFTNYYMAYMVCILSVIYFIFYYFGKFTLGSRIRALPARREIMFKDDSGNDVTVSKPQSIGSRMRNSTFIMRGCTFAFAGIAAFLISACALLPVYFVLKTSSATTDNFPTTYKVYFNILDFLANHLAGLEPTIRSSGDDVLPNIYCGIITLILVPLYLFCNKVSYKQKICAVIILAVFYFSFDINYANFVWHGLHFPNDLPYRFSFGYSFFLLMLAYNAFANIKSFTYKQILAAGIGVAAFIIIIQKVTSKNVYTSTVFISLIFTGIMTLLLMVLQNKRWEKTSVSLFLLCAVTIEIIVANTGHYLASQTKTNYAGDWQSYQTIRELTEENESELFYRTELTSLRARMDPCWYNYHGTSTFSSMAYENVAKVQRDLGMYGNDINSYTYNPQTVIYNSMHAIKYLYDKNSYLKDDYLYTKIQSNDKWTSYQYKYYLPIAYSVSPDLLSWNYNTGSPIDVQNSYMATATGVSDVLNEIPIDDVSYDNINNFYSSEISSGNMTYYRTDTTNKYSEVTFTITIPKAQRLYVYVDCTKVSTVSFVSDSYTGSRSYDDPMILDIGDFKAGEKVTVTVSIDDSDSGTLKFHAAGLDMSAFTDAYNTIVKNGTLNVTSFKDTDIKGTIDVTNNSALLYTSIPYDPGWTIYIDGVKADASDIHKVADAYLSVNIGEGSHTVEFKFMPQGLLKGMAVSFITLIFIAAFAVLYKKKIVRFPALFGYAPEDGGDDEDKVSVPAGTPEGEAENGTAQDASPDSAAPAADTAPDIEISAQGAGQAAQTGHAAAETPAAESQSPAAGSDKKDSEDNE